jgi:hypothetical protein
MEDIVNTCNSLNENSYQEKIEFVEKNFELAQKYITILDRFEDVVKIILKDK